MQDTDVIKEEKLNRSVALVLLGLLFKKRTSLTIYRGGMFLDSRRNFARLGMVAL